MQRDDLQPWVVPAGVGIISFAAGVVAGYFLHKRQWDYRYAAVPAEDDGVEYASFVEVEDELEAVQGTFEELGTMEYPYETVVAEDDGEVLHITIFDGPPEPTADWDYSVEVPLRDEDGVYVIHKDEFMDNPEDNDQSVLTYYEGDQVLCDEEDVPIYNHTLLTGPLLFGKGSGDPNVVYIRNAGVGSEFEILRDRGYYQVEVLGAQIEEQMAKDDLRHSKSPRKFRSD